MKKEEYWDIVIKPSSNWFELKLKEVWKYKDLIFMFVKRDFVAVYKQTILGPLWFLIQPAITALTYIVVFSNIAHLSTDQLPPILFYLSGILFWNYFSSCFLKTSDTFSANVGIFGKVYFPRLAVPFATVLSSMISFAIQFVLFIAVYGYYILNGYESSVSMAMLIVVPYLIILMAALALGLGIIISSMTTKYRDLRFLVTFGVQLLMYATPVVYPISMVTNIHLKLLLKLNPMTAIIEAFRFIVLGSGDCSFNGIIYSSLITLVILIVGILVFNKVEKNFMDTI